MGIAAYLTVNHYRGGAPVCFNSGCETVQRSRYAELFGMPVAVLGLAAYVVLLSSAVTRAQIAIASSVVVAFSGLAFGAYLAYVQLAVLHAVCVWCVASDILLAAVALVTAMRLHRSLA